MTERWLEGGREAGVVVVVVNRIGVAVHLKRWAMFFFGWKGQEAGFFMVVVVVVFIFMVIVIVIVIIITTSTTLDLGSGEEGDEREGRGREDGEAIKDP